MSQGLTAQLAKRSAETDYATLPAEIRAVVRQCMLDWFAVTLAGTREELSQIIAGEAADGGDASLVGMKRKTSPLMAALVNGTVSHALDYDDVHLSYIGHTTVACLPAILALGESLDVSGRELITAFVAGYETTCRVGVATAPGHYALGFHATGTAGSFGAAAAAARLMKLDAEQTAVALGIAATQATGLKSMFGTACKPLHAGKAAQNGLLAARLAAKGFSSRPDAIECAQGFAQTHGPDFHPEAALAAPPAGWYVRGNLFKYHAACYLTHAPIECALAAARRPGFQASSVRKIALRIDRGADSVCNIQHPRTGLEAKFSLRLTIALALAGRDTASLATYSEEATADPRLLALAEKLEITFEENWPTSRAILSVTLADGSVIETEHDSGIAAPDVAAQGERIVAKYMSLAAPVLGEAAAARLRDAVEGLDEMRSVRGLMALAG